MSELIKYFRGRPWLTTELVGASLFANLLALASPLFVMQVLNRYVAFGVDSTLTTLTAGVICAIGLELAFRQSRHLLARSLVGDIPQQKSIGAFGLLVTLKRSALDRMPVGQRVETLRSAEAMEGAYGANSIATVLDAPFSLMFLLAIGLLSPTLGLIVAAFAAVILGMGVLSQKRMETPQKDLANVNAAGHSLTTSVNSAPDTVRLFGGHKPLIGGWMHHMRTKSAIVRMISTHQSTHQALTQSIQGLMGVVVIAVGAILVVKGQMDVGGLIGINILSARALAPLIRLTQLRQAMSKAAQAQEQLEELTQLPSEQEGGTTPESYLGGIELKDVSFSFPDSARPQFEKLSFALTPGTVLVVRGSNGAGKTTLMRLLTGLLEPERGQVLADGTDTGQLDPEWWRQQLIYLPQEPSFFNGTLMDNLRSVNSDIDDKMAMVLLREVGLESFIAQSKGGLKLSISNNGRSLALGIRRRLALARALAVNGRLVLMDEPTEGLDREGCAAVFQVMKRLSEEGRTLILVSGNETIIKAARLFLDMDGKPTPRILTAHPTPPTKAPVKRAPVKKAPAKKSPVKKTLAKKKPAPRAKAGGKAS